MSRFARLKRTAKDRENDLIRFLEMARPEKVREATADGLAASYGVPLITAKYRLAMALQGGRLG